MPPEIEINGQPYSVVPGTYKKFTDSDDSPPSGTWMQRDFVGGQLRSAQLEADRGWLGIRCGPAVGGQGVEAWPYRTTYADGTIATATTQRIPHLIAEGYAWMAIGRYLYRSVSLVTATWANWTMVYDAGATGTISSIACVAGKIITCNGPSVDMNSHTPGGGNAVFMAGQKGWRAVGYAGQLVWSDAADPRVIKLQLAAGTFDTRTLDSPVSVMCLHGGKIAVATQTSIYTIGGRKQTVSGTDSWLGEPEPLATLGVPTDNNTADMRFLISYSGRLYTWLAGQVQEWSGNSLAPGWRPCGLEGRNSYGACVANGVLIVSIATRAGTYEVWAFNGDGWWRIHWSSNQARVWPCPLQGAGDYDFMCFRSGSGTGMCDMFRLLYRGVSTHNYPTDDTTAEYITSLVDAGRPDLLKHWTSIGTTWAIPEERGNSATTDDVILNIYYSLDAGETWTWTANVTKTMSSDRASAIIADLSPLAPDVMPIPASRYLQIKIEWYGIYDWSPVLTSIWADWVLIDNRRVRWRMKIRATDKAVKRDGSVDARAGREISADLWEAWETSTPIEFTDIDEDSWVGVRPTAIIMSLAEDVGHTSTDDVARDSVFTIEILDLA